MTPARSTPEYGMYRKNLITAVQDSFRQALILTIRASVKEIPTSAPAYTSMDPTLTSER